MKDEKRHEWKGLGREFKRRLRDHKVLVSSKPRHENGRESKLAKLEERFGRVSRVCKLKRARIMRSYENLIKKMERSI